MISLGSLLSPPARNAANSRAGDQSPPMAARPRRARFAPTWFRLLPLLCRMRQCRDL